MKLSIFFFTVVSISLVWGCTHSPIPLAKHHEKTEQNLWQSAHHWEVLAEQQANKMIEVSNGHAFYLPSPDVTIPFIDSFHSLLISKLVSSGAKVYDKNVPEAIETTYDLKVITHDKQGFATHSLTDYQEAIFSGREASEQKIELLITTTGVMNSEVVFSDSEIYYIYKKNSENYTSEKPETANYSVRND